MDKRPKIIEEARTRYQRASDYWSPIYDQIREDLEFSDPTDPKQWPEQAKREREKANRPCMTYDLIGQFVRQVVNTARRNKPAIKYLPVDDESDPQMAEVLQGLARQVEYSSRADVAYIAALDTATRGGLGFFRLVLEEVPNATVKGQQCAKIVRVPDFEAVLLDPDFVELDGSDCRFGFVQESMSREVFRKKYPKAKEVSFDEGGWFSEDSVRVCEYYRVTEKTEARITVAGQEVTEEQYQALILQDPTIEAQTEEKRTRVVEHYKISGEEVLEESTFPAEWVPVFPVLGNESWIDGKRNLGGCVRTAKDAQISYNLARNAEAEAVSIGPKAPWIAAAEAIEGYQSEWKAANSGNVAVLTYNSLDDNGNAIPQPQRIAPAGMQPGWVTLREASRNDVQAALGMFEATVGNNPNQQSGRAVLALQDKADVGSFHYVDNLALAISHCGRVLTQVWPRIYDAAQVVRIIGEDDEPDFVAIDPEAPQGYAERPTPTGGKQIVINPNVGRYDVRVTVGPNFTTRQTEAAAEIGELVNGNPQMLAILGDVWVKMRNFPEADKIAKRLKAMLPPQIQQAEEDQQQQIPPEVQQTLQQAAQEIQQLRQALQEAQQGTQAEMAKLQQAYQTELLKAQTQIEIARENNDAKRDVEELKGMVQLLIQQMQPPPMLAQAVGQDLMNSQ